MTSDRTPRWQHILPLSLLLASILIVWRKLAFTNLVIARGDAYKYFYPYWTKASEAFRAFELPLWNPDLFMGVPLLANSQIGFFYPLNWPVWLLLPVPYAVTASIVIHLFILGAGTYFAARRALKLSISGAFVAALLFTLGGFITAQAEHVNQLQGMAWLPWLMAVTWQAGRGGWRDNLIRAFWIGLFFTMQLLAGHTQATFITGIGIVVWIAAQVLGGLGRRINHERKQTISHTIQATKITVASVVALGMGVVLAVLVAAAQLAPTLELTSTSQRQGGLSVYDALSFSLHPLLVARALLPGYGQKPYAEYIAYLPLTGLFLAVIAVWFWRRKPQILAPLALVFVGVFLAIGLANPIYVDYLYFAPGFDLFRAPARWMLLYSFGAALLAGAGWDAIQTKREKNSWLPLAIAATVILGVMALSQLSATMSSVIPLPEESPAATPLPQMWAGWLVELAIALGVIGFMHFGKRELGWIKYVLFIPMLISAASAADTVLADGLTTPEAFFDVRPSVARLQAAAAEDAAQNLPPGRYLSMSKGGFDAGDQAEIDTIYADQLSADSQWAYTVSVKDREILVPNLPLVFGLSAIDGFDGGLLPSGDYAQVTNALLQPTRPPVDGRLHLWLEDIPQNRYLDMFNVRFLITDKIGDQWFSNGAQQAFFDLQQRIFLAANESVEVSYIPQFEATEIWLVTDGDIGTVVVEINGQEERIEPVKINADQPLYSAEFSTPAIPTAIRFEASETTATPWQLAGLTLFDKRDQGSFTQIIPGGYRMAHSGDVKVYENLDVMPRAYMVNEWGWVPDIDLAITAMSESWFDPHSMAVLEGSGSNGEPSDDPEGVVEITDYSAESITMQTSSTRESLLVVAEANYPGWHASIDGENAEIATANGLFKGMIIPPGEHVVEMVYRPNSLFIGAAISVVGLLAFGLIALIIRRHRPKITT